MAERVPEIAATGSPVLSSPALKERRIESRFQCDPIPARLQTDTELYAARILDISTSGMCVEIEVALPVPCEVTVYFPDHVVAGEIRYCRPDQNVYLVGLQIQDVIKIA